MVESFGRRVGCHRLVQEPEVRELARAFNVGLTRAFHILTRCLHVVCKRLPQLPKAGHHSVQTICAGRPTINGEQWQRRLYSTSCTRAAKVHFSEVGFLNSC